MNRLDTEARKLLRLREDHERKDAAAKKAAALREEQEHVVEELMEDLNQPSARLDLGEPYGEVTLILPKPTIYARVIDKDVALKSIEEAGMLDAMFDRTIRKAPANQWIRECLERGEELPDGFDYSKSTSVRVKRKKS